MWFTFAVLSSLLFTVSRIIERHLLKGDKDFWAYSLWFSAIGAAVTFPLFLTDIQVPKAPEYWLVLAGVVVMIVLHNFLNFSSSQHLPPSFKAAITKLRLIWTMLFGIVFLSEALTFNRSAGAILTILAGLLVIGNLRKTKNMSGVWPAFLSTVLYSLGITAYSFLLEGFNPISMTFLIFLMPALINFALMPNAIRRCAKIIRQYKFLLIASTVSSAFANILMNYALDTGSQSDVIIIMEASLVAVLVAEFFILKEKGNIRLKLIAILLATLGAILVGLK